MAYRHPLHLIEAFPRSARKSLCDHECGQVLALIEINIIEKPDDQVAPDQLIDCSEHSEAT
jgi:hypothetical protein